MATVGRIARAHGNRGQVIVDPETDFPNERFKPGSVLHIQRDGAVQGAHTAGCDPGVDLSPSDSTGR